MKDYKSFYVENGGFFGLFNFFHTEDAANNHLLTFQQVTLTKNIVLDNGTVLKKGRVFEQVCWNLKECRFSFCDWIPIKDNSNILIPKEDFVCSQAHLMTQGWWADQETTPGN